MKKFIFIVLSSFIILLFTSKYSMLYPFNDWLDANSFETVARSVLDGKILYKDIVEQKGPILYLIYIIGQLMPFKNISGIFVLEVISMSILFFYMDKVIRLFKDYKYAYVILPIFMVILTCSNAFVHGGSSEEFSLPFLMVGIYYFIYYLKNKELSYKQLAINGVICAIVAMIKFNLIGLWFAFMAFLFFDLVIRKDYKKAFISCVVFLGSAFITLGIILSYFIFNNAISDFIYCYFTINVGAYTEDSSGIIDRIITMIKIGGQNVFYNHLFMIGFPILIYSIYKLFKSFRERIGISLLIVISFMGIYIGLRSFKYYSLPILLFYFIIFIYLGIKYYKYIEKFINNRFMYLYMVIYFVAIMLFSYKGCNYGSYILTDKMDYEQFKIANIIKNDKNPNTTILNYGSLDYGIYNILDIVPNCKYFHRMNISYEKLPDNYEVQNSYIKESKIDYVIIGNKEEDDDISGIEGLDKNYKLIYTGYQKYEKYNIHFYLFKLL